MVLADEINRATPKAQSALLEAMEERQVTVEGETRPLPQPFFVIATQNPAHQIGTFPLPESQLDRFLMRIELGYPDHAAERALLEGRDRRSLLAETSPILTPETLMAEQQRAAVLHVAPALIDYVQALAAHTRTAPEWKAGLSPRAGLGLLAAARSLGAARRPRPCTARGCAGRAARRRRAPLASSGRTAQCRRSWHAP